MLPRKLWPSSQAAARKAERRRFYVRHADELRQNSRKFRIKNPEKAKALHRAYYEAHREEIIQKVKAWQTANRERKYAWNRKRQLAQYGLTPEQYELMLKAQNGACAICGSEFTSTRTTHVDHDHATGRARALLCRSCNQSLGHLEKDEGKWLTKALAYLANYNQPNANNCVQIFGGQLLCVNRETVAMRPRTWGNYLQRFQSLQAMNNMQT